MNKLNKIVFIDDDHSTNEYHKFITHKANVADQALFFESAETALAYLSSINSKYNFPDLIFIDIKMPGMNGHEFVNAVRSLPNFNDERTELAYLATTLTNDDVKEYSANGMKHFYFKNLSAVRLCKIAEEIFNLDFVQRPLTVTDHREKRL